MLFFSGYKVAIGSALAFLLMTTGCQSPMMDNTSNQNGNTDTPSTPNTSQKTLMQQALRIQRALASNNHASIITDIHPTRGVRFSMYAYVRPESDKVFSRAQFSQYLVESKIRFTWGALDGTGDPLITPLPTYLDTWVDAKKFNNTPMKINEFESRGGMINNVNDVYPNLDVVDFYYQGTDEYSGMDWRGMRLVFDEYQGSRYLVAIINDQWTV